MTLRMAAHGSACGTAFDNRYELISTVGFGRESVVYEAQMLNDLRGLPAGSTVALKVFTGFPKHRQATVARMRREASAMLASRHPNVIRVFDSVQSDELCYIVMEFAERGDLASFMDAQRQPLSPHLTLNLVKQLLAGLHAIHEAGIIHCDIKPENLLLTGNNILKIADFGISVIPTEPNSMNEFTGVGTFDYLAPEILSGGRYGVPSDLYAVGVTLFKLLTMHLPFEGETLPAQIESKVSGRRKKLSDFVEGLPAFLEPLLGRALAVDPVERFSSAEEFQFAIDAALDGAASRATRELPADVAAQLRSTNSSFGRAGRDEVGGRDETEEHGPNEIEQGMSSRDGSGGVLRSVTRETLFAYLRKDPLGPLKAVIATTVVVLLLWAASIEMSGSGFALNRDRENTAPATTAPRAEVGAFGVLYDLLGEEQHVTFVASATEDPGRFFLSTDIPGWTPQLIDTSLFQTGSKVSIKSGGMLLTLKTGESDSAQSLSRPSSQDSAALTSLSGSYSDLSSGREGRWVIWR